MGTHQKQQKPIFFLFCRTLFQVNAFGATSCQNKHPSTPLKCCLFGNTPLLGLYFTYYNMIPEIDHKLTKLHFTSSYKFCAKSCFQRFVQKLHEFCVMVNMNDIYMYSIS